MRNRHKLRDYFGGKCAQRSQIFLASIKRSRLEEEVNNSTAHGALLQIGGQPTSPSISHGFLSLPCCRQIRLQHSRDWHTFTDLQNKELSIRKPDRLHNNKLKKQQLSFKIIKVMRYIDLGKRHLCPSQRLTSPASSIETVISCHGSRFQKSEVSKSTNSSQTFMPGVPTSKAFLCVGSIILA